MMSLHTFNLLASLIATTTKKTLKFNPPGYMYMFEFDGTENFIITHTNRMKLKIHIHMYVYVLKVFYFTFFGLNSSKKKNNYIILK